MKDISKVLKNKIITHEELSEEEVKCFLEYVIYKGKVIADHMPRKYDHAWINLIGEICFSYGLPIKPIADWNGILLSLNQKEYWIHPEYHQNEIAELTQNHYMELTDNIRKKYKL